MILDTAISSISEETGINRGGIDVEITDGLPVAIKCTLILIILSTFLKRGSKFNNNYIFSFFSIENLYNIGSYLS